MKVKKTRTCGIPIVYLQGSLVDWQIIMNNIKIIQKLNIDNLINHWFLNLMNILQHFINAYIKLHIAQEKVEQTFWKTIIHRLGEIDSVKNLDGWIIIFSPFNKQGYYLLTKSFFIVGINEIIDLLIKNSNTKNVLGITYFSVKSPCCIEVAL